MTARRHAGIRARAAEETAFKSQTDVFRRSPHHGQPPREMKLVSIGDKKPMIWDIAVGYPVARSRFTGGVVRTS